MRQSSCPRASSKKTRVYRRHQYLTPQETRAILDAMDDMSNALTLRDRATGKLAYYTGLRCCDIAAMDLTSIGISVVLNQSSGKEKIQTFFVESGLIMRLCSESFRLYFCLDNDYCSKHGVNTVCVRLHSSQ